MAQVFQTLPFIVPQGFDAENPAHLLKVVNSLNEMHGPGWEVVGLERPGCLRVRRPMPTDSSEVTIVEISPGPLFNRENLAHLSQVLDFVEAFHGDKWEFIFELSTETTLRLGKLRPEVQPTGGENASE